MQTARTSTVKVPAKIILTGEHSVVYGIPAISTTIPIYLQLQISYNPYALNYSIPENIMKKLCYLFEIPQDKCHFGIKIISSFPQRAGLGSSAALSVALVKAFASLLNIHLTVEELNAKAYVLEKYFHLTPSGIDNTTISYNQLIEYTLISRQPYRYKVIPLIKKCKIPILLIVLSSREGTSSYVKKVKPLPAHANILNEYFTLFKYVYEGVKTAITECDINLLGKMFYFNQGLLNGLGVSTFNVEYLIHYLRSKEGIYGAKITGAGGNGAIIATGEPDVLKYYATILSPTMRYTKYFEI